MTNFRSACAILKDGSKIYIQNFISLNGKDDGYTTEMVIDMKNIKEEILEIRLEFDESSRSGDT